MDPHRSVPSNNSLPRYLLRYSFRNANIRITLYLWPYLLDEIARQGRPLTVKSPRTTLWLYSTSLQLLATLLGLPWLATLWTPPLQHSAEETPPGFLTWTSTSNLVSYLNCNYHRLFFNIFENTQARKNSTVQKTQGFFRPELNKPVEIVAK